MHCLICGTELDTCVCPRCSFDQSLCRELYPTLSADESRSVPLSVHRDALYRRLEDALAAQHRAEAAADERDGLRQDFDTLRSERDALRQELASAQAERDGLRADLKAIRGEREALRKELHDISAERDGLRRNAAAPPEPSDHSFFSKKPPKSAVTVGNWLVWLRRGKCTILGSTVPLSGSVIIPSHLADSLVVAIADSAFEGSGLTTLSVPKSVACIGKGAFRNCKQLVLVFLSYQTKIEAEAFSGCRKLARVNYPSVCDAHSDEDNIDPTAFLDTDPHLLIAAPKDSAPYRFAARQCYTANTQALDNLFTPPSDLL